MLIAMDIIELLFEDIAGALVGLNVDVGSTRVETAMRVRVGDGVASTV